MRLDRAAYHLNCLGEEIRTYTHDRAYIPVIQNESALQQVAVCWEQLDTATREEWRKTAINVIASEVRPQPDVLPLLIGDFFHNLRAALDNIAYVVVKSNAPPAVLPPGWESKTYFSIRRATAEIARDQKTGLPKDPLLGFRTTDAIERAMDGLQPYNTGDRRGEHLARIRDLNDWDKHRALHVVLGYTGQAQATLTFPNGQVRNSMPGRIHRAGEGVWLQQTLESQAYLSVFPFDELIEPLAEQPGNVEVDVELEVVISLDELGAGAQPVTDVVPVLEALLDFVRHEVTPVFAAFV